MRTPILQKIMIGFLALAAIQLTGCSALTNSRTAALLKPSESADIDRATPNRSPEKSAKSTSAKSTSAKSTSANRPSRLNRLVNQGKGVAKKTGQILAAGFFYIAGWMIEDWCNDAFGVQSETNRLWHQGYGYNNPNPQRKREGNRSIDF